MTYLMLLLCKTAGYLGVQLYFLNHQLADMVVPEKNLSTRREEYEEKEKKNTHVQAGKYNAFSGRP